MMKTKQLYLGYVALALAQGLVGANIVINKFLVTLLPIFVLLQIRFSMSCIILFSFLVIRKIFFSQPIFIQLTKSDWWLFIFQALCANFLFNTLIISGMCLTTAIAAGIITSFIPALIALFSYLVLHEKLPKMRILSIILGVLGLIFVGLSAREINSGDSSLLGKFIVFLAIIPEAFYTILAKRQIQSIAPYRSGAWILLITSIMFIPFSVLQWHAADFSLINWQIWLYLLISASFSASFFILWPTGLSLVPASLSALFVGVMPISAIFVASIFLGEHLTYFDFVGLIFVLISIILGTGLKFNQYIQHHRINKFHQ